MKQAHAHALAALMLAVAWPCAHAGAAGNPEVFVEDFHCVGGKLSLRLPATLPQLMRMGRVQQESVQEVEQWEGYTATRKTVAFGGLTLGIVTFSNQADRYMLTSAEITDVSWKAIAPFAVGQPVQAARKLIGAAAADDDGLKSTYMGENDSLRFEVAGGKVTKVVYRCHSG